MSSLTEALGPSASVDPLISDFRNQQPVRAGSLIITAFGDAIAPRGGEAWTGSLITLLDGFGVNERLVRTSIFRLAQDGWLEAKQVGRKSYYRITPDGERRFAAASRRIYAAGPPAWDGAWCLVIVPEAARDVRDPVRKELGWLGFGSVASNVLAHPSPDIEAVTAALAGLEADSATVMMHASSPPGEFKAMQSLVRECWDLDALAERYRVFLGAFETLGDALMRDGPPPPLQSLQARLLLIHEFRKVLLRAPDLPAELLPADWPGLDARSLCREVYAELLESSEAWLSENVETSAGKLPPASPELAARFGVSGLN